MLKQAFIGIGFLLTLVACAPSSEPDRIAEPQREALQKAKELAASQEQISEETKKAIEAQTN